MSFLSKLFSFGKKSGDSKPAPTGSTSSANDDHELITIYDKFGREMQISKGEWRDKVLRPNLQQNWNQPDELYSIILSAFQDGHYNFVEDAAKRLAEIDPTPERGNVIHAIVYQQTNRPAQAEKILLAHLDKHGDDGVVLTNLAKAQDLLGRKAEAMSTLWRALELDPNQDNALLWYAAIEKEKQGEAGSQDVFQRVAALPGSWRAQLWLARTELENGALEAALALYGQSLERAPSPKPTDQLQQISGDLGDNAHLPEILQLVAPHFSPETHGLSVGNNLIKANLDLGRLDDARVILHQLHAQQRPDWGEHLHYWEQELAKAKNEIAEAPSQEDLKIVALKLDAPFWLKPDKPYAAHFPQKTNDAPTVVFVGSSVESPQPVTELKAQHTDAPGRMSRSLPLYLAEQLFLNTEANATTIIPWLDSGSGGFIISSRKGDAQTIAHQARSCVAATNEERPQKPLAVSSSNPSQGDYAVYTHLITSGENWTLQLSLIRTIDGTAVSTFDYKLPEYGFHHISEQVQRDLSETLSAHLGITFQTSEFQLKGPEIDHYLLRLEQCLAVRCDVMGDTIRNTLSNPADIIDGTIAFCMQNPKHIPGRILLSRTLDGLKKSSPELTHSYAEKVQSLNQEYAIEHPAYSLVASELTEQLHPVTP
ncbi:MAG: hypothetical protein AAGB46_16030 [Verrucomicrobiota bacterium]